jgi:hypothetical protein
VIPVCHFDTLTPSSCAESTLLFAPPDRNEYWTCRRMPSANLSLLYAVLILIRLGVARISRSTLHDP